MCEVYSVCLNQRNVKHFIHWNWECWRDEDVEGCFVTRIYTRGKIQDDCPDQKGKLSPRCELSGASSGGRGGGPAQGSELGPDGQGEAAVQCGDQGGDGQAAGDDQHQKRLHTGRDGESEADTDPRLQLHHPARSEDLGETSTEQGLQLPAASSLQQEELPQHHPHPASLGLPGPP